MGSAGGSNPTPGGGSVPTEEAQRLKFFRELAHVVHLGRCTRWPFGGCTRHEEPGYFTPKDNDVASSVLHWLQFQKNVTPWNDGAGV